MGQCGRVREAYADAFKFLMNNRGKRQVWWFVMFRILRPFAQEAGLKAGRCPRRTFLGALCNRSSRPGNTGLISPNFWLY